MRYKALRAVALATTSALVLAGCSLSVYDYPLPGGADVGDNAYDVTIQFRNAMDLVPQSAVKVDDVTVGRVESVTLDDYIAEVKVRLRGDVRLPENAEARLRQTSLLGEKFVSLGPPAGEPRRGRLEDGDEIPLERSGRNPEVEEVLGALSLLLNGGGLARLKTIMNEFSNMMDGKESDLKHLLGELETLMSRLDNNKEDIVAAIEAVNRLSKSVKGQTTAITSALDRMPAALESLDSQRDDLVKMLQALSRLSGVGVRVIKASKENTVRSLRSLDPILTQLAAAGDAFPKALEVLIPYPFANSVVGKTPAEARNLHMGDYTNLDARLNIDLLDLTVPGLPPPLPDLRLGGNAGNGNPGGNGGNGNGPNDTGLPPLLGNLDGGTQPGGNEQNGGDKSGAGESGTSGNGCALIVALCRPAPGYSTSDALGATGYDGDVAALLLHGVVDR